MKLSDFVSIEETHHVSLESSLECMALEAGFLTNMVDRLRESLPAFATELKESIASFVGFGDNVKQLDAKLKGNQRKALMAVEQLNFISFAQRTINVPEGFQGKFLPYAKLLIKVVDQVYKAQNTVIPEYTKLLSQFLTNKEDKLSLKDHSNFYKRIALETKQFQSELDVYKGNKGRSKAVLKQVIDRFSDLDELYHLCNTLTNSQSNAQLRQIKEEVQHCVDLLDLIIAGVQSGNISNVSPEAAINISNGAFEIARYVRFISQVYFTVDVFLNIVDQLTETLSRDR